MRRRDFMKIIGGLPTAWPLAAWAQQGAMPVIGFLHAGSPEPFAGRLAAFRKGLREIGYVEGDNVSINYRWAHDEIDRLPSRELAVDVEGPATVEGYTVIHDRDGAPELAIAACLLGDKRRIWATSSELSTATALCGDEWVGRDVAVTEGGRLALKE